MKTAKGVLKASIGVPEIFLDFDEFPRYIDIVTFFLGPKQAKKKGQMGKQKGPADSGRNSGKLWS